MHSERHILANGRYRGGWGLIRILTGVGRFYYEGFRTMTVGRTLWAIIIVKLVIMFAVLKVFFFPNFLNTRFESSEAKSRYVLEQLTGQNSNDQ